MGKKNPKLNQKIWGQKKAALRLQRDTSIAVPAAQQGLGTGE